MGDMKMHAKYLSGNLKERDPLEDLRVDGRIFDRTLQKWCGKMSRGISGELI
jgi:hypothetical protein